MLRTARWRPAWAAAAAALSRRTAAGGTGARLLRPLATRSGDPGGGAGGRPESPASSSQGAPGWQVATPRWNEAARAWRPEREAASEAALREAHRQLAAMQASPAAASLGDGGTEPSAASAASSGAGSSSSTSSLPSACPSPAVSPPDVLSACASGLEACRRVGRWAELLALFDAMRGAGVARNARAFEHGMTAAMVLERFDLALAIWAEMRAPAAGGTARAGGMQGMGATEAADMGPPVGAPLRPTARAFNAAMSALERSGRSAEALALYKQMEAEGVAPDSDTVHVVISACETAGAVATAVAMLRRLEDVHVRPPARLYAAAIRAAAAAADGKSAFAILLRMRAQRVPRSPSTYDAAIAASTPSPTPGLALTPGATGDAGAAAGLAAGGLEDAAGGWGASSPWSGAASAGGVRRGGASGGGRAGAGGDASPLGPLIGIIEALLSESPPLIQAVLADQRATSVLLHACAALGRPKEALAILEAGGGGLGATTEGAGGGGLSGPGDALTPSPPPTSPVHVAPSPLSPPPAPLAEWRRLALRACAAGPYADEAASLLRSLGQVASPSAYADAVAAAAAGRRWQDVLALHAALKERIAAPGGGALWGEGGAEGAGALASAGVAAITAHGKLNQLHDAAAVFTDAWPAAHARRVGAAGGGGTGGSGGAGAPGLLAAEAGRAQAGGRSAAVPTQAAASPPPATQPPPALSSSSPPCLPPSPPAPRLIDAYNALLLACLDCNDPQRALALLSAMRAEGHPPNALSLTAAITAAQRLGQHEQVLALVEELHQPRASWRWRDALEADAADAAAGAAADAAATPRAFGGLAGGVTQARLHDRAGTGALLSGVRVGAAGGMSDRAGGAGLGDTLRMGAYNGRLTACLRDGQLERAVTLFEEMGQRRVPRNTHTLALGAEAMASLGEWLRPLECIALIRRRIASAPHESPQHAGAQKNGNSSIHRGASGDLSGDVPGKRGAPQESSGTSEREIGVLEKGAALQRRERPAPPTAPAAVAPAAGAPGSVLAAATSPDAVVPASALGAVMGACAGAGEWRAALSLLDPTGKAAAAVAAAARDANLNRTRHDGTGAISGAGTISGVGAVSGAGTVSGGARLRPSLEDEGRASRGAPASVLSASPLSDSELEGIALRAVGDGAVPPVLCAVAMGACVNAGEWARAAAIFDAAGGGGRAHGSTDNAAAAPNAATLAPDPAGYTESALAMASSDASAPLLHAAMRAFEAGGRPSRALALLPALSRAGQLVHGSPTARLLLGQALASCVAGGAWAEAVRLLHSHGGDPLTRSGMVVRAVGRCRDARAIGAMLCARRAAAIDAVGGGREMGRAGGSATRPRGESVGAAPPPAGTLTPAAAAELSALASEVEAMAAGRLGRVPSGTTSRPEAQSGQQVQSGEAQPRSDRHTPSASATTAAAPVLNGAEIAISPPTLEGAELGAVAAAFASCGEWEKVSALLEQAAADGRRVGAVQLQPAMLHAKEAERWKELVQMFTADATVNALPSLLEGAGGRESGGGGGPARSELRDARGGATDAAGGAGEEASDTGGGTSLQIRPLASVGTEMIASTEDWSQAAAAGFAVELAAAQLPPAERKGKAGRSGGAGAAGAGAAAGAKGSGETSGDVAGSALGRSSRRAAELSRGAVGAVLGMTATELSTRAARDAASVVGASAAAGAAAAAAVGPHGLALGAVAGMAAGMARVHGARAASRAAAALQASAAAAAATSAVPAAAAAVAAAAAAAGAAGSVPAAGGRAARRGRWWWDVGSYRLAMAAARRLGDWRSAIAILQSLRDVAPAAFSQPPEAVTLSPSPSFGDYATLRSLGMEPPPLVADSRPADAGGGAAGGRGETGGRPPSSPSPPSASAHHIADDSFYTSAIAACLRDGSFESLNASIGLLALAEKANVATGPVYGAAMQAQVKLGRRLQAWRLLRRARVRHVPLITMELNIGIGAGARCGQLGPALALLREMRAAARAPADTAGGGPHLTAPDVGTYDALLFPLASAGQFDDLLRLFDQMQEDGLAPIESHYILALRACAERKEGGRAAATLLRMQARGMRYGKAAAVTMLACNRAGAFQTSLDIFNAFRTDADARVTQQANPPHQDTAAGKGGGTAGGSVSSVALAPPSDALQFPLRSLVVFNEAVEAMRREGMVEEAVELVVTMRARFGVPPDHATFGSALAGCREAGEPALVTALLDALFIELEERQREAREDARAVAAGGKRRLWRQPLLPSDALHSELIGCFGRFGEPRRALRLFAQLLSSALPLHNRVFNRTLIALSHAAGLARQHLADQIVAVGHERAVWGEPMTWSPTLATFDSRPFLTGAPMLAGLHYWLRLLGLRHGSGGMREPPAVLAVFADDGSRKEGEAEERLRLLSQELQELGIDHAVADPEEAAEANEANAAGWAGPPVAPGLILVLSPAAALEAAEEQLAAAERRQSYAPSRGGSGRRNRSDAEYDDEPWYAEEGREAPRRRGELDGDGALDLSKLDLETLLAGSAPADALDESLDRLGNFLAPRDLWVENARRGAARQQAATERVLRERGLAPPPPPLTEAEAAAAAAAKASRKEGPFGPSRWPPPMPDGNVPWSTPRPGDLRPRDNVFRAAPSRARPPRRRQAGGRG